MMNVYPEGHGSRASGQQLTVGFGPDMPDYAGENDDISIMFDDTMGTLPYCPIYLSIKLSLEVVANVFAIERDRLCGVLPAPVKGSRRSMIK